jgi:ligand-binding sensor domain-containing protein/AraC-like DNA-binding protein
MRACKTILVFILILFLYHAKAENKPLRFQKLNAKSGLKSDVVYSMLQDSRGFIWLGTKEGINRFDGYKMRTYSLPEIYQDKIAHQRINALCEDKNGLIWIGTPYGVLQLEPNSGEMKHFLLPYEEKGAQSLYVNDIVVGEDNSIWAGSRNGLYQFNPKENKFVQYPHFPFTSKTIIYSKGERIINDLCFAADGKLWIATAGNGISILDIARKKRQILNHQERKDELSSNYIKSIFKDHEGVMWIATVNGLNRYNSELGIAEVFRNEEGDPLSLSDNFVTAVGEDQNHNLWIGTKKGLDCFKRESEEFQHYQKHPLHPESISSNTVLSFLSEKSGSFWVATMQGVNYFTDADFGFDLYQNIPDDKNSLVDNTLRAAAADRQGKIWVGTLMDGINCFDVGTQTFTSYKIEKGNKDWQKLNAIRTAYIDSKENVFFGTDGGLLKYNKGKDRFEAFTAGGEIKFSKGVFEIMEDQEGNYWFSEIDKGLWKWNPKQHKTQLFTEEENNLNSTNLKVLLQTKNGDVWVGSHLEGLGRLVKGQEKFINYQQNKEAGSISNNRIYAVFQDSRERLWIGTGNGLNLFNEAENSFTSFTKESGLPGDVILSIQQDSLNRLWLGTNNGLCCFDVENNQFANFSQEDGLQANIFEYKVACSDGKEIMCFGGNNGLNSFNPYHLVFNQYIPGLCFTQISSAQGIYPIANYNDAQKNELSVEIKNTDQNLVVELAAMSFVEPEKNRFRYRISSLDSVWTSLAAGVHEIQVPKLKVGDYKLEVLVSNNHLKWNETPKVIRIQVKRNWEQYSWLFYGLLLLLTVFVLYFVWLQKRRPKAKSAKPKKATAGKKDLPTDSLPIQTDSEWAGLVKELNDFMEQKALYKDKRLTKGQLANQMGWSETHLSNTLREALHVNFNDFINSFRVKEIKIRLNDPKSRDFTLLAIAEECGFNSKTSFYRIFKKFTGLTPSEYLDQLRKKN